MGKFKLLITFVVSVFVLTGCVSAPDIKADVFLADRLSKTPNEVEQIISDSDTIIIDVRTPEEFSDGCISNAKNIDIKSPEFLNKISELDKDGSYLVYCRSGARSSQAIEQMKDIGFENIVELYGGVVNWEKSGHDLNQHC